MKLRIWVVLLAVAAGTALAQAQTVPDALVVSVKGNALVRSGKDGARKLLRKGDKLFSGQQVMCDRGCRELKISYCNVPRPIIKRPNWTTILSINCSAAEVPRGGARKGAGISITTPRESEVVRPETFSLRWEPYRQQSEINISVKIDLGEEIWRERGITANTGHFESDALKEKLKETQRDGELYLILLVNADDGTEPELVKFRLISLENEQALNNRLEAFADEPDKVFRHIGRGLAFSKYELYSEAVQELEEALSILRAQGADPDSVNGLMRLLIMTNYQAYNDERVRQLCLSLGKPGPPPATCYEVRK